uniref:Terpene synthase N-terminal domain-containing protein n=1 Tax=Fagus sylvatica TaxID=28930 RepID=A0A2N9FCW8_FAGSY
MLTSLVEKLSQKLNLIDVIQRLSVSYHFENDIEKALQQLHMTFHNPNDHENDDDLYTVALQFRLLRQQGYRISCDKFTKFKESNGNFKESLISDARGMLSLYEATHLRVHGEAILDEALVFSATHLKSMATHLSSPLAAQVSHALKQPIHIGIQRLEARRYFSIYQEDPSHNKVLLTFAKLDFNLLQKMHQKEVSNIARRILTKMIAMTSVIDDIYDVYGTFEEIELFTEAVETRDISAIDQLPKYMKVCYRALLDIYYEMEEILGEERSYRIRYAIEAIDSPTSKPFFLSSMLKMSKDHWSAGLWWSLLLSGGSLGGHSRLLSPFSSCLITFCFSWCCRGSFRDGVHRDQWTKGRTSFLFMISCFSRWFCGGVRRGPMDNGKDQLPSSLFLVSIGAAADHFFWKQAMTAG